MDDAVLQCNLWSAGAKSVLGAVSYPQWFGPRFPAVFAITSLNAGYDFILLKKLADRRSALLFSPCASGPFATPFRNYTRLDADFAPCFHLPPGDNVQGKTNVFEANSNRYLPWLARLCYI
jgi:hypothetical protein